MLVVPTGALIGTTLACRSRNLRRG